MTADRDRLFLQLPAAVRQRDAEIGGPLQALLGLVGEQVLQLREDLRQLYDDQFIETCAEWVVPYIGDLLGHEPRHGTIPRIASPRAEVARTVGYRRRKGTTAALQQVGQDVSGWPLRIAEVQPRLATAEHLNFPRPDHLPLPDLRRVRPDLLASPFTRVAVRPDLRADRQQNLPDVVAQVWRLRALPLQRVTPFAVDGARTRFTFSPLGDPVPLFSRPPDSEAASLRATRADLPAPISRRELLADLRTYYGADRSLWVRLDGELVPAERIDPADLSDDPDDPTRWGRGALPVPADQPPRIAIDPVLGRLALSHCVKTLEVGFHLGAVSELGGGQYERDSLGPDAPRPAATRSILTGNSLATDLAATLAAALPGAPAILELSDSATYPEPAAAISVPAATTLTIRAADRERPILDLAGDLTLTGGPASELVLDGLLLTGAALVVPADAGLRRLVLRHCTLVPGLRRDPAGQPLAPASPSLIVHAPDLELVLQDCVTGPLRAPATGSLSLTRCIVDAAGDGLAIAAADLSAGPTLDLDRCTILGRVRALALGLVTHSIVHGPLLSERRQTGCLRYSLLPLASQTPRRFHCLPGDGDDPRLAAQFSAVRYGAPAYAQLSRRCAPQIRGGADDEAELGVFHDLFEPHREGNLRARLDEYLRLGLRVGVTFVT